MRLLFILLASCVALSAHAQNDTPDSLKRRVQYYVQVQAGALIGCDYCGKGKEITFSGAVIQGIKINTVRVGVGLGHDSYRDWNTAPIFLSASWDAVKHKNALVIQVNYGTALNTWRYYPYDFPEYGFMKTEGKAMFNPSIGYRIHSGEMTVTFAVGYRRQVINTYYQYPSYQWTGTTFVEGEPSTMKRETQLSRLMFTIGVGWR